MFYPLGQYTVSNLQTLDPKVHVPLLIIFIVIIPVIYLTIDYKLLLFKYFTDENRKCHHPSLALKFSIYF